MNSHTTATNTLTNCPECGMPLVTDECGDRCCDSCGLVWNDDPEPMSATKPQHTPALDAICAAAKLHNAAPALAEALQALVDFAEMAYAEAFAHASPPVTGMLIEGAQSIAKARAALAAAGLNGGQP